MRGVMILVIVGIVLLIAYREAGPPARPEHGPGLTLQHGARVSERPYFIVPSR